jgi:predicted secreted protein
MTIKTLARSSFRLAASLRAAFIRLAMLLVVSVFATWGATAVAQSNPNNGPGGPILVVTSPASTFGRFYAEILRTEGFNSFAVADISTVSAGTLTNYDVVILANMPVSASQASMFSAWVNAGGSLIAMDPDSDLASLLGITTTSSTLSNAYLLVNNSTTATSAIVNQTIQFHGTAHPLTTSGATSLATLYSSALTPTSGAAVTLASVGSNGGQAAAFAFDLATSIVYTRQGNPAWAGQHRAGNALARAVDMFWGPASGDPQPNWVDLNKVSIAQADEQQRLLANLIITMNMHRKPLPRFWYFPRNLPAAVVHTGDDHGINGTAGRFDSMIAASPAGCSVADWRCIRGTSYIFPNTPLTNSQVAAYQNAGFEIGLHVNTSCVDYTQSSLDNFYATQWNALVTAFPSVSPLATERHHCVVWSDWASGAKVQLARGVRLDTNYYWPPQWIASNPGQFTGSAMPMRFADTDGTLIDVYQVVTQMTDEAGQIYPATVNTLLDRAIGAEEQYGAYTVNAHTDNAIIPESTTTTQAAVARGLPVISAKQLLTWLDGRNSSSFSNIGWAGNTLTFTVNSGTGAMGLTTMLPYRAGSRVLSTVSRGSTDVPFEIRVVKGIEYATFVSVAGSYAALYITDTVPLSIVSRSPASGATNVAITAKVTVTFSEQLSVSTVNSSTFELRTGSQSGALVPAAVTYDSQTFKVTLTPSSPLAISTQYTVVVRGGASDPRVKDLGGTALAATATWSFTTSADACPCGLWTNNPTPVIPSIGITTPTNLGVRFRSDLAGTITAIRFYKGANNTGTHTVYLWTSTGTLLAQATATNETATGWQTVTLSAPVSINANAYYVASYFAPQGGFAVDDFYFQSNARDNGVLHAPANTGGNANGVYAFAGAGTFPSSTLNSSNYWVDVVFSGSGGGPPPADTTAPTVSISSPTSNPTHTTSSNSLAIGGSAGDNVGVTQVTWSNDRGGSGTASGTTAWSVGSIALLSGTNVITVTARDAANNSATDTLTVTYNAPAPTCPCSLWPGNPTPAIASLNLTTPTNLGVRFRSDQAGYITAIRFYKGSLNTGSHTAYLWSGSGQLLVQVPVTNESATGWQTVTLPSPVAIAANTYYVASYFAPQGGFAVDDFYFQTNPTDNGILHAPANTGGNANGVYAFAGAGTFPASTLNSSNYWVDVVFETTVSAGPDVTPPTISGRSPAIGATGISPSAPVAVTFSETMSVSSITTSSIELRTSGNVLVPATVSYSGLTATLVPSSALAANSTYTVNVRGGATDPRVKDLAGNALAATSSWSFTTGTAPPATSTIWSGSAAPGTASLNESNPLELGVKFRSDVAGYIRGIRFYKGSLNTGTHIGNLWTTSGTQLATATFTNETASGWQQVNFATPVAIAANTTYIASYFAPQGGFAVDTNYFASAGVDNGTLHALSNAAATGNGVFLYGSVSQFPVNTFSASNYWVDVVFSTTP